MMLCKLKPVAFAITTSIVTHFIYPQENVANRKESVVLMLLFFLNNQERRIDIEGGVQLCLVGLMFY